MIYTNTITKDKIIIYDIDEERLEECFLEYDVKSAENNLEIVQSSKFILIAVIPQEIDTVLREIGAVLTEK